MIGTLIYLIVILCVCLAFLGVIQAVLAMTPALAPFGNVIYALAVLVMVLVLVSVLYPGPLWTIRR